MVEIDQGKVPAVGQVLREEGKPPLVVYKYPRGMVTGSIAVSCEFEGKIYFAVCHRKKDGMTMAGTSVLFDFPGGLPNPGGPADESILATALRSLKNFFGLTREQFPALLQPFPPHVRSGYSPDAQLDMSKPQRGFGGDPDVPQVGVDYMVHIGQVKQLPPLQGKESADFDTQPTWVDVSQVKKVREPVTAYKVVAQFHPKIPVGTVFFPSKDKIDELLGAGKIEAITAHKTTYRYDAGDQPNIPRGTEMLPGGGMDKIEALVAHARDLPYREAGFNGVAGFIKLVVSRDVRLMTQLARQLGDEAGIFDGKYKPETQTGAKIEGFYSVLGAELEKFKKTQIAR